jgi:hypothetical protein
MPRGPLGFKQRDVTRAIKATTAAGHEPVRVEIFDSKGGKIVLFLKGDKPASSSESEWDKALSNDR